MNRSQTEELRNKCQSFEISKNIKIANFARLKNFFGDKGIYKKLPKIVIMHDLNFFNTIWESLIDSDKLYDKLANYNEELDANLSSNSQEHLVDHWRNIELLVEQEFVDLFSQIDVKFKTYYKLYPYNGEKCVSSILYPIQHEFDKFENRMRQVQMIQNQPTRQ